ncbi:MAG: cell surface protein SprA, partial [Gemmatimonadales bacterium]
MSEPLELRVPRQLTRLWDGGSRRPAGFSAAHWDSLVDRDRDSIGTARVTAWRLQQVYGRQRLAEEEEAAARDRSLIGVSKQTVDVGFDGNARIDIRTEKLKNHRCTPASYLDPNSGCRGGFKPPRLDTFLQLRSSGVIGQRLHLDVDFDTERDFTATNNLQIYYQGLEDEIVQRVEVGTVTFRPPPSRFLTASIPANNFGVNASFELGPVQFQGLVATQKGSQIGERIYTVGATTVQPQDRQVRDIDYEAGRFYWVVDPRLIPGYPRIDILQLDGATLPPAAQISQGDVRVYRYRPSGQTGINPNLGGINAIAIGADTTQRVTAQWELMQRDLNYYIDPSGVWLALAARLDPNDYLAVSYRSTAGQVGTFPATDQGLVPGQPPSDTLRLIVQPKVGPPANDTLPGTFRQEMRHIYRVAGADLDLASLKVNLSLSRSEAPQKAPQSTYLSELGLAVPTDPQILNTQERIFPRVRDPSAALTIKESYIVFPALAPFADTGKLQATERNDSLYRTPGYLLYTEGPPAKFLFRLRYNASSTGDRSSLDLGALQIRDGSEALFLNGRRLERGVEYSVNYDLGQVSFLDPQGLFGDGGGAIRATFEERGIFAVAPTKILGFTTRYNLGEAGGINLVGVYQAEESAFNRPQLGFEASANLVGGISTDLKFRPQAVTRFFNHLTSTPSTAPSRLDLNAELALTRPDPNRSGAAYLEEFEGDRGVLLSLRETVWEFGSAPQDTRGVQGTIGAVFDPDDAVQLTWQNLVPEPGTGQPVQVRSEDIDPRIQVAGSQDQLETVLYLTLHPDTAGGQVRKNSTLRWTLPTRPNRPRWRSMVTGLSSSGVDLSKNEYLEFWVFHEARSTVDSAGVQLVIDLGNVSEDAIAIAPETLTVVPGDSLYSGRQLVGLGRLDTERQPTGIFNAEADDIGILGDRPDTLWLGNQPLFKEALCKVQLSTTVLVYPWGDLGARCTNGNGFLDTEDLDADNQLNATGSAENVFRWVVDLRNSQYYTRTGVISADGSEWRLYRIPLRAPEDTIGTPNVRLVKHFRMTVVGEPDLGGPDVRSFFALARMRFLGAPWFRRSDSPVSSLAGATGAPLGDVVTSSVSTENTELGYTSPPGVYGGTAGRGGSQGEFGTQVN